MKIIYLGTPQFAVAPLRALYEKYEVVAVVTQLDKPKNRGKKIEYSPVKQFALEHNIPVYQFEKIRRDGVQILQDIQADVMVTCAYGQILSADILNMKKYGVLNIHGSLLPKYRGASPVQCALLNGETKTGITILKSGVGIDDGPILYSKAVGIDDTDNATTLFEKLSPVASECIITALQQIEDGTVKYTPQDEKDASVCKMIKPEFAYIDFNKPAYEIVNKVRGLHMWPMAQFCIGDRKVKVCSAKVVEKEVYESLIANTGSVAPGTIIMASPKNGLIISALDSAVEIMDMIPQNSKQMSAKSFCNGTKIEVPYKITNQTGQ